MGTLRSLLYLAPVGDGNGLENLNNRQKSAEQISRRHQVWKKIDLRILVALAHDYSVLDGGQDYSFGRESARANPNRGEFARNLEDSRNPQEDGVMGEISLLMIPNS